MNNTELSLLDNKEKEIYLILSVSQIVIIFLISIIIVNFFMFYRFYLEFNNFKTNNYHTIKYIKSSLSHYDNEINIQNDKIENNKIELLNFTSPFVLDMIKIIETDNNTQNKRDFYNNIKELKDKMKVKKCLEIYFRHINKLKDEQIDRQIKNIEYYR